MIPERICFTNAASGIMVILYSKEKSKRCNQRENIMSVARVTEISSSSKKSFDDAVEEGIKRASKTLRGITGAWVKEQKVSVKDGKVAEYRVNMMVTFVLED